MFARPGVRSANESDLALSRAAIPSAGADNGLNLRGLRCGVRVAQLHHLLDNKRSNAAEMCNPTLLCA